MVGVGQTVVPGLIWFTIVGLPILAVVVAIALVVRWPSAGSIPGSSVEAAP